MHFGRFKLITFLRIAKHKETWCFCRKEYLFLHFLFCTFIRHCFVISFWHVCYTFSLIPLRYTFLHYHVFDVFVTSSTIYVLFVTLPRMYMLLKISLKFSLQIVEITKIFHARRRESFSRFALNKKRGTLNVLTCMENVLPSWIFWQYERSSQLFNFTGWSEIMKIAIELVSFCSKRSTMKRRINLTRYKSFFGNWNILVWRDGECRSVCSNTMKYEASGQIGRMEACCFVICNVASVTNDVAVLINRRAFIENI